MPKRPPITTPTPSQEGSSENPAQVEHIKGRYNLGVAVISGVFGVIVGVVGLFAGQDTGKFPVPSGQPTATVTVTQTATPSVEPSAGDDSELPTEQTQVLISAHLSPSDTVGKDKALACVQPKTHCLWIVPSVIGPDGPMDDGCNLTWQLVTNDGAATLIDQGRAHGCNSGFYVGNDKPVPPGGYGLNLAIETDAGEKYAGQYDFTLVSA